MFVPLGEGNIILVDVIKILLNNQAYWICQTHQLLFPTILKHLKLSKAPVSPLKQGYHAFQVPLPSAPK